MHSYYHCTRSWQLGRFAEIDELQRSIECSNYHEPNSPMAQWHLAAYHQLGVARVLLAYTNKEKGWMEKWTEKKS